MRFRGWFAAVGAVALVTGVLATASPAFGGGEGSSKPWPILRVEKTIGEADDDFDNDSIVVPEETEFVIRVTCESQHKNVYDVNSLNNNGPFVSELTFDSEGDPEEADPSDKWHTEDDAFVTSGWWLKNSLCTAEEIDPDDDDELEVAYKCEASASVVQYEGTKTLEDEAAAEFYNHVSFGCVEPLPEGVYHPEAEQAQVQFTHPWDWKACHANEQLPWDEKAWTENQNRGKCQEIGTLTVDNFDPSWIPAEVVPVPETPVAIEIAPKFTG